MSLQMSSVNLQHRGPCLRIIMNYCFEKKSNKHFVSQTYEVSNLAAVRFSTNCNDGKLESSVSAKKLETAKDFSVEIKVTSKELQCSEKLLIHTEKWSEWKNLGQMVYIQKYTHYQCRYDSHDMLMITIQLDIGASKVKAANVNAKIYNDDDFIDFHLTAADGSVGVHKVYLAAQSDVFKSMLQGKWKETEEGYVELEGLTQQNLEHFKEYLYLGTLPGDGLCPLLLLARYFLIDDLKEECIKKIVETVTADDLYSLLEFSCQNNLPELTFGILNKISDETVDSAYKKKCN